MQSERNQLDDFLQRKLDEAPSQLPDHNPYWQKMKTLLPLKPAKKVSASIKTLRFAATVIPIAVAAFFLLSRKEKDTVPAIAAETKDIVRPDTSFSVTSETPPPADPAKQVPAYTPENLHPVSHIPPAPEKSREPRDNASITVDTASLKSDKAVHHEFYTAFEKTVQTFSVNPGRDTVITCAEGTTISIPAGSFQTITGLAITGLVQLYVHEFYRYTDIISYKLTTTSGNAPLETGGMIHIEATSSEQPVVIRRGASLQLKMPTQRFEPRMQLFTGSRTAEPGNSLGAGSKPETTLYSSRTNNSIGSGVNLFDPYNINWSAVGQQQYFLNPLRKVVSLINFRDNPYTVTHFFNYEKGVAKYRIPWNAALTTDEVKTELEKRYGKWYKKIKVKRESRPRKKFRKDEVVTHDWYKSAMVADSISIPLHIATRLKLISPSDSVAYERQFEAELQERIRRKEAYMDYLEVRREYTFSITGLGWINCDRFLDYPPSRLTQLLTDIPDGFNADFVQAMIVFRSENAAIPGSIRGREVRFDNIPVGHRVHIICTAVKDGKMYAAVQEHRIEKFKKAELQLEPVTPEEFRGLLSHFGSVQQPK